MREKFRYFKNGNIKSTGIYKDGVKYGRWIDYFENGQF